MVAAGGAQEKKTQDGDSDTLGRIREEVNRQKVAEREERKGLGGEGRGGW